MAARTWCEEPVAVDFLFSCDEMNDGDLMCGTAGEINSSRTSTVVDPAV